MTTYARLHADLSFDRLVELTAEEYVALVENGKAAWLRLYSVDTVPTPTSAQRITAGPYVTDETTTRKTWVLVDKTQEELDAEALNTAQAAEKPVLAAALALFDSRTATSAQVQRAIAWLIRQQR